MTEKEKMLSGQLYDTSDLELASLRSRAHLLCQSFNAALENERETREAILSQLLSNQKANVYFQGPIFFDYGLFTTIGENFSANYNLTVLDCAPITIGDNVMFGPNCTLVSPVHPLCWQDRNIRCKEGGTLYNLEYAKAIVIGSNCWIASNVTIIGGVTIGEGAVIGAGSVVVKDIPPNTLAVGNPCRPVRLITDADRVGSSSIR